MTTIASETWVKAIVGDVVAGAAARHPVSGSLSGRPRRYPTLHASVDRHPSAAPAARRGRAGGRGPELAADRGGAPPPGAPPASSRPREVAPGAAERDEAERFDRSIFARMGELGLTGAPLPESVGGAGFSYVGWTLVMEELGAADMASAVTLSVHILSQYPVVTWGTAEQRERWLRADDRRARRSARSR